MSRDREFIENLCIVFASRKVLACLETSEAENFQIFDDKQRIYIADGESSKSGFRIYNPRTKKIHIFATDNCFFHERDSKRCDCIAFDDTCLCFVELKLEVEARRQATHKADDARKQLGATINFFQECIE